MRRLIIAVLLSTVFSASAALADEADNDATPVTRCEDLPASVTIKGMTAADTLNVCREMLRDLVGAQNQDVTAFEKVVQMMRGGSHEPPSLTHALVDIIQLRGMADNREGWYGTLKVVALVSIRMDHIVPPSQVADFLRDTNPNTVTKLSDSDFLSVVFMMTKLAERKASR